MYGVNRENGPEYLFNLTDDPNEMHNLIDDPACTTIRRDLHGRVERKAAELGDDFFLELRAARGESPPARAGVALKAISYQ
jgi:hypothetical protein